MKRLLRTFTLLAAVAATLIAPSCRRGEQAELRLMSYNVRNCRGLDDSVSYERIARIITDANADAVAIQELDSMTTRYPQQDVLGNLAALTGMYPTYAPSIDYAGGKYGIGMLSRQKPLSHRRVPLPCRSEPRSLLIVEFPDYYFCCTHLSLNAEPDEPAMQLLAQHCTVFAKQPAATFPADDPASEIDYICQYGVGTRPQATLIQHHVIEPSESADVTAASDHRPIIADVRFTKWIASVDK